MFKATTRHKLKLNGSEIFDVIGIGIGAGLAPHTELTLHLHGAHGVSVDAPGRGRHRHHGRTRGLLPQVYREFVNRR